MNMINMMKGNFFLGMNFNISKKISREKKMKEHLNKSVKGFETRGGEKINEFIT